MSAHFKMTRAAALLLVLAVILSPASAIECYQCSSTDHDHPFQCSEFMPEETDVQATSCDAVHGAQYCIKLVGRSRVSGWLWSNAGIRCYQCSSHGNMDCTESAIQDGSLEPQDCSHINGAKYCVKTKGRTQGVYSTIRQCSSLDLGNYCNYVKLQGDVMDYRSCVYTCSSDGCNGSQRLIVPSISLILLCAALLKGFVAWL